MPPHPRKPRRPKTISAQGVLGQKGINLIERVVLDMESRWTPSGANEIGIDGYIEFFDPTTRKPLGLTLAVQSKVATALGTNSSATFTYSCRPADIEYWLSGSMPVVLIVSNPATDEAYWISVKDYFKDWTPANRATVVFDKSANRFAPDSLQMLLAAAAPREGLYLAPAPTAEVLHSNLLCVEALPDRLFVADTECRTPTDVWAVLRRHHEADAGWVVRSKRLMSFHDLAETPWADICDTGTVEGFATTEWSDSVDADRRRVFVQLLNQTLRAQLSPGVRYWPKEDCFAIVGKPTKSKRPRKLSYRSLRRKSTISVVSQFSRTGPDGQEYESLRHLAFRGQFRYFDTQWYLEITPTYRFTRDGFELDRFHEDKLKGIKRFEGNRAVLSSVLFWAHCLRSRDSLLEDTERPIQFGHLLTFDATLGINDAQWGVDDTKVQARPAASGPEPFLPVFEDLDQ